LTTEAICSQLPEIKNLEIKENPIRCEKQIQKEELINTEVDSTSALLLYLYKEANNNYIGNNLSTAYELYNQFIKITLAKDNEKKLWIEIRISLSYMSSISLKLNNIGNSTRLLKEALGITLKYNKIDFENIFYFLIKIARNYQLIFDYYLALDYLKQAELVSKSSKIIPLIDIADLNDRIAMCFLHLNQDDKAQEYIDEAIKTNTKYDYIEDLAKCYNNVALVQQSQKKYTKALDNYKKSLSTYEILSDSNSIAFVLNNIGNYYLEKESLDTSKIYYDRSLRIRETLLNLNKEFLIHSYNNIANINNKLGKIDSALFYNNLAINYNFNELILDESARYHSGTDYIMSISDRIEINLAYFQRTNNKKYLIESFYLFSPTINNFINELEKYTSIISSNDFISKNKRFFDNSISSAHLLDSIEKTNYPRSILISETYKTLCLINLNSEICIIKPDSIIPSNFNRYNIYSQLQQKLFGISSSSTGPNNISIIDSLIKTTIAIDKIYNESSDIAKSTFQIYFANLFEFIILYVKNINQNQLIIDYYFTNDKIFIHTISNSKIICQTTPLNKDFSDAIHNYPYSIKSINNKLFKHLGSILSITLLSPIKERIVNFDDITIITDDLITEIPFETLPWYQSRLLKHEYFLETKDISYRHTLLKRNNQKSSLAKVYTQDFFGIAPFELKDTTHHNLNGSAKEIYDINDIFDSFNLSTKYLIGKDATFNNFIIQSLNSRILHFSTHSNLNESNSSLSFLELFPIERQSYLNFYQLSNIPFHNDLLILNACESGKNLLTSSTGNISFIKGLFNSDINNYICTLWKIYDDPACVFILDFYKILMEGENYKKSLSLAKRNFIKSKTFNDPIFWSSFVLYENN
jgi:CHAT domain-containing protein/tetratricopeptide (TPR) repeat protein